MQGAGIRILTPTISSPTLADQLQSFIKANPQAKWHVYEPVNRDNVLEGAKLAFGQPVETQYDFSKADVILSLDADFLYAGFPGFTRYVRDFAKRRNPDAGEMSRLYVVESTPTSTGARADHRLPVRARDRTSSLMLTLPEYLGPTTRNRERCLRISSRNSYQPLYFDLSNITAPVSSSPVTISRQPFTPWPTP